MMEIAVYNLKTAQNRNKITKVNLYMALEILIIDNSDIRLF